MYAEAKELDEKNEEEPYMEQEIENPLYEATAADDAVLNPIYDRFVFLKQKCIHFFSLKFGALRLDRYDISRFVLILLFRIKCFSYFGPDCANYAPKRAIYDFLFIFEGYCPN